VTSTHAQPPHLAAHDRALALHARAHRTGHTVDRDRADAALTRWAHHADHLSDAEAMTALDLSRPVCRPARLTPNRSK
jgi:hypothetical protein